MKIHMITRTYSVKPLLTVSLLVLLFFAGFGCGDDDSDNTKKTSQNCATITFDHLYPGSSVEGLGTVHPDLSITSSSGSSVVIEEGNPIAAYSAPNDSMIWAGCLGDPGSGLPVAGLGKGFADNSNRHDYVFTFSPGKFVEEFSVTMLDFGDYNPTGEKHHEVVLTAYDATGRVRDKDILSYDSSPEINPRTSDFGDLWYAGDACTAKVNPPNKEPGVWTFKVSGAYIVKVKFEIVSGIDPNIGFDNITFCVN
jgi:hypothetical protein